MFDLTDRIYSTMVSDGRSFEDAEASAQGLRHSLSEVFDPVFEKSADYPEDAFSRRQYANPAFSGADSW